MTQVAELEQQWRRTASLIRSSETPWERIKRLSHEAWGLGAELLETPVTGLSDVAIKVEWLAEQDLDSESTRRALRCILNDLRRLERQ